jgi:uncharacterized protein
MNCWLFRLAPLLVLVALVPVSSGYPLPTSADVVKATATADKPDAEGKQTVTITLTIEKPYHLYANPVGVKELADTQTVVTISAGNKPIKVNVTYPEGKLKKDEVVGDYKIYEDMATIKATVVRAKEDTSPLIVEIQCQACTDKQCLLPGTLKVPVK